MAEQTPPGFFNAMRDLTVSTSGFYVGAPDTSDGQPPAPEAIRRLPIVRLYTGEVVGHLDLNGYDAGILANQLSAGVEAPRQVAALSQRLRDLQSGEDSR